MGGSLLPPDDSSREFALLAEISESLQLDYKSGDDEAWANSRFGWLKRRSSRQVGAIGERLVSGWLESRGFRIQPSPDPDADRLVDGHRVEIKFSTLWQNGCYKFQQLRNQNYEYALCLGISPHVAHCWVLPKAVIMDRWRRGDGIQSQHGGGRGSDTAWLSVVVAAPDSWLTDFGGTLSDAEAILRRLFEA